MGGFFTIMPIFCFLHFYDNMILRWNILDELSEILQNNGQWVMHVKSKLDETFAP